MTELILANREQKTANCGEPLVSALLLTIGESTTANAREGLRRQTVPLHENLVVVENIHPFSNAFNQGVSRIGSPFFIQCDADMILDENCVEVLLSKMTDRTGMVVGLLKDPLQGNVQGVKLYRTHCCRLFPMLDRIDCESFLKHQLLKNDWAVTIVKVTLGTHDPDPKDLLYQFERFKFMAAKIRARKQWPDLANRIIKLVRSENQEIVTMAVSAMICGYHLTQKNDYLGRFTSSVDYRLWLDISSRLPISELKSGSTKLHPRFGMFNSFIGYWNGLRIRRSFGKSQVDKLIQDLHSDQLFRWAYVLGFVSALTNVSETIPQNFLTRTFRMIPFLIYLRKKLNHHIHSCN